MGRISAIVHSDWFREAVRYTLGCGSALLLKIAINSILTLLHLQLPLAYLVATAGAVTYAFFYHRYVTFGTRHGDGFRGLVRDFAPYLLSVSVFSLLDYLLVVIAAAKLKDSLQSSASLSMTQIQLANNLCILCSSVLLFTLRFFVYRLIFHQRHPR